MAMFPDPDGREFDPFILVRDRRTALNRIVDWAFLGGIVAWISVVVGMVVVSLLYLAGAIH